MIKKFLIIIVVLISFCGTAQTYDLSNSWYSIGPEELPSPESNSSSKGIGPIEFIRTTKLEKGLLLAGSLNGGLFYSSNAGEYWLNAGSDSWTYSTSTWADFYPENQNIWFASSHEKSSKKGNGELGFYGGVHRTVDKGLNWERIADYKSFGNRKQIVIYKTVFHPKNPKKIFVLTSEGLFFTNDCLAAEVKWYKDKVVTSNVYDLIFIGDKKFVAHTRNNEWVLSMNDEMSKTFKELKPKNILKYTFTKDAYNLYLLVDYKSGGDKIFRYNYFDDKFIEISRSQRVLFGSGRAFKVNPHNKNEIYLSVSTRLRRWNIEKSKFENLGSDYHVDVEFVELDPFDENIIYMANHGGVYISYDKGKSWDSKSKGLGVAEVLGMAVGKTDPNQIVIGTFHDGSSVYADWDKNGQYYWKNVNGGDALIPLINPENCAEIYTSNQYSGGGIYFSSDTAKTVSNIHSKNKLKTSGWKMSASLHPTVNNCLFFNAVNKSGDSKGNYEVIRTFDASKRMNTEKISDFKTSHQLNNYFIYAMFTSKYHPNMLLAYVINARKNEDGKNITEHKLFRTFNSLDSLNSVVDSWHELELPRNSWLADVVVDKNNRNKLYFSYVFGNIENKEYPSETSMVFYAKYRSRNNKIKRNEDISYDIALGRGGKYNLVYSNQNDRVMFIGTASGVFMRTTGFFGWKRWKKVGFGLPHCMVYGLDYNEDNNILTVGLKGRGVWRISIESTE